MAGANKVPWPAGGVGQHPEGFGAVVCGNTRRDPLSGVHTHRVGGATRVLVLGDHEWQIQLVRAFVGHRGAEKAAGVTDSPRQPFGRHKFGRHDDVTFVLAIG